MDSLLDCDFDIAKEMIEEHHRILKMQFTEMLTHAKSRQIEYIEKCSAAVEVYRQEKLEAERRVREMAIEIDRLTAINSRLLDSEAVQQQQQNVRVKMEVEETDEDDQLDENIVDQLQHIGAVQMKREMDDDAQTWFYIHELGSVQSDAADSTGEHEAGDENGTTADDTAEPSNAPPSAFECLDCKVAFDAPTELRLHWDECAERQAMGGVCAVSCSIAGCGRTFTRASLLRRHTDWHAGRRPYGCDVPACGRTFAHQTLLAKHMRKHSGGALQLARASSGNGHSDAGGRPMSDGTRAK